MPSMGLLGAAVANNASWCDAVCRSHGYPGVFSSRMWSSTRHRLRLYPNAITLRPEVTAPEVLAAAASSRPFAVKDSFARLDLAPAGFRLLAGASWIGRDGGPDGSPGDGLSWDKVTGPGELTEWETAWVGGGRGDGPVFRPGLLSNPRCVILACRREGAIIADGIVYAAGGAVGISNLFSTRLPPGRLWASIQSAVAGLQPRLPVVGYEEGASLEAARRAGFRVLGTLRVWSRPSPAPSPGFLPQRRHQPGGLRAHGGGLAAESVNPSVATACRACRGTQLKAAKARSHAGVAGPAKSQSKNPVSVPWC